MFAEAEGPEARQEKTLMLGGIGGRRRRGRHWGRTLDSASPLTAHLAGENARLRPSPHCPPGDTHSTVVSSLHCPFQTIGCLWEGPSTALSVAEQDPLLGNRLRIMTTAMAALLRAALPAICYSVAPEPSPRPLTSQSQA